MGFSFRQQKRVRHQVRAIASQQIDAALELLAAEEDFDDTVHALRRRCKKVRGLLRLIKPNFAQFDAENAAFRDAAASLSASRDAAVMIETFDALWKDSADSKAPLDVRNKLRNGLEANARRIAAGLDRGALLEDFGKALIAARQRVEHWQLESDGFDLLRPGLETTYERLRQRMRKARDGDDDAFHDWRKDAKYHWFHVSLLKRTAPDVLGARIDHLDRLGEYLGDHHNLAVLGDTLETLSGDVDKKVIAAITRKQRRLAKEAFRLGGQLSVERPAALVARFENFWKLLPKVS